MVKYAVHNSEGKEVGSVDLAPEVFGAEVKPHLVHAAVRWQLSKRRAGTHQALTRTMMEGGKKKPWKQKGTGRARAGSSVSPLWVGGASVHGPLPRSYEHRLSKKVRALALASALSSKVQDQSLWLVDELAVPSGKTKDFRKILGKMGNARKGALVVVSAATEETVRSMRNIQVVESISAAGLNVYDVVRFPTLVATRAAVEDIQARLKVAIGRDVVGKEKKPTKESVK